MGACVLIIVHTITLSIGVYTNECSRQVFELETSAARREAFDNDQLCLLAYGVTRDLFYLSAWRDVWLAGHNAALSDEKRRSRILL